MAVAKQPGCLRARTLARRGFFLRACRHLDAQQALAAGQCAARWGKVKHRFLIRQTTEVEDEHIALQQWYAASPEERKELNAREEASVGPDDRWESSKQI
jgi:hypothetical protein